MIASPRTEDESRLLTRYDPIDGFAERAREQRLETAELLGLELTRGLAKEARMRRWNALDLTGDE